MTKELLELLWKRRWLWVILFMGMVVAVAALVVFATQRGINPFFYNRF